MIFIAVILGALSRRIVGWGGSPRWPGLLLAFLACIAIMAPYGAFVALLCAFSVPLAFGLPKHGETMNKPVLMGLRNGAFTALLAVALWAGSGIQAWAYAPVGFLVGLVYWGAKKYAPEGPEGGFYDGWVSAAELGLGACLVGGLALI
jgi:hypothetical protein